MLISNIVKKKWECQTFLNNIIGSLTNKLKLINLLILFKYEIISCLSTIVWKLRIVTFKKNISSIYSK